MMHLVPMATTVLCAGDFPKHFIYEWVAPAQTTVNEKSKI